MILSGSGVPVSFACEELIRELKRDIAECGKRKIFAVWLRRYPEYDVELAVNYDFVVDEKPITKTECGKNERIVLMEAEKLLELFKKQNDIINTYEL